MLFPAKVHRFFYLFGLISLGFGMMLGAVPTSVPQFVLLINWLLEGQFKQKWQLLKSNLLFWVLQLIFIIHIIGLIYTEDVSAGIGDLQIKLPLMILPLVFFSSEKPSANEIKFTFYAFLIGALINTLWCLFYSFILNQEGMIRNTSRFMSHIRLGLYLNMAVIIAAYFLRSSFKAVHKIIFAAAILYYILVMYLLGLASGLFILILVAFFYTVWSIIKQGILFKLLALFLLSIAVLFFSAYFKKILDEQFVKAESKNNYPQKQSLSGNKYIHFDTLGQKENGYYIYMNIQLQELQKSWNMRCPSDSFSFPPVAHNLVRYDALVRYMASMGLTKDSTGVSKLNEEDLLNVQKNIPNYRYKSWSNLHQRIYELANEYDNFREGRSINGQSVTMRFYFWKAALAAISEHPIIGCGTGDVQLQMNKTYEHTHSPLTKDWYKRPHNQFLTVTVALGVLGLLVVCFSLFFPFLFLREELNYLYYTFMLITLFSFLVEDTIETQAGVTFFAFFNNFLLMQAYFKRQQNLEGQPPSH